MSTVRQVLNETLKECDVREIDFWTRAHRIEEILERLRVRTQSDRRRNFVYTDIAFKGSRGVIYLAADCLYQDQKGDKKRGEYPIVNADYGCFYPSDLERGEKFVDGAGREIEVIINLVQNSPMPREKKYLFFLAVPVELLLKEYCK